MIRERFTRNYKTFISYTFYVYYFYIISYIDIYYIQQSNTNLLVFILENFNSID